MPKGRLPSPTGRYGPRSRPHRITFAFIACAVLLYIYVSRVDVWADRDLPTQFASFSTYTASSPLRPDYEARYAFVRKLSAGKEGQASIYKDTEANALVVIKRFHFQGEPQRNPVPEEIFEAIEGRVQNWPAEIPGTLIFGGIDSNSSNYKIGHDFVPMHDYFLAPGSDNDDVWDWHMVTPLIPHGTLDSFAPSAFKYVRDVSNPDPVEALDTHYRPAFNRLLSSLKTLHEAGLCHDDIKSANVFVNNTRHWLLGDLGAVRHVNHPWHLHALWRAANQWPDCQQNDLRRIVKVYLQFLRAATPPSLQVRHFDNALWEGEQPWSRLYWTFLNQYTEVDALLRLSTGPADPSTTTKTLPCPGNPGVGAQFRGYPPDALVPLRFVWAEKKVEAYAVTRELTTKMEDYRRMWSLRDGLAFAGWEMESVVRQRCH